MSLSALGSALVKRPEREVKNPSAGTDTSRETDPGCSDSFGAQIQAFDGPRTKIRYYF